jgi:metal-responsive CopG/Arc/MetJ family transcriptional regulator
MKPVQLTMDEALLEQLDRDPDVVARGRSAVVREAVAEYLVRRRRDRIAEAYQRGYGAGAPEELTDWSNEGAWPAE